MKFRTIVSGLLAAAMLLPGVFLATADRSDAQTVDACPAGFQLTADTKQCFQAATRSVSPGVCEAGQLTVDGSNCFVPATAVSENGDPVCPDGFSPDDSLGGTCARFESATEGDDVCPSNARGVPGACYILVAKSSAVQACTAADTAAGGVVVAGATCVITGPSPTNSTRCPVSATVFSDGSSCYELVAETSVNGDCVSPYLVFGSVCKVSNTGTSAAEQEAFVCPTAAGVTVSDDTHTVGGITKIVSCFYDVPTVPAGCPASASTVGDECRRSVALVNTGLACDAGFTILADDSCVRYAATVSSAGECPVGSSVDADGNCRKPVGVEDGPSVCENGGTLNGDACLFTAGFTVEAGDVSYVCAAGTSGVVGGDAVCLFDAPDVVTAVGCVRGVLSVDGLYCLVDRVDVAPVSVPVPAFTG